MNEFYCPKCGKTYYSAAATPDDLAYRFCVCGGELKAAEEPNFDFSSNHTHDYEEEDK
ncbi:MAG: hypothetical protein QMD10_10260 [Desulfitobacteriaceae bacterium]|nr:hypothetical protein [Desulfitobacteriaceae bacterium]